MRQFLRSFLQRNLLINLSHSLIKSKLMMAWQRECRLPTAMLAFLVLSMTCVSRVMSMSLLEKEVRSMAKSALNMDKKGDMMDDVKRTTVR